MTFTPSSFSQLDLLLLELLSVLVLGLIVLELVGNLLLLPERNVLAALVNRRQLGLGASAGRHALALGHLGSECAKEIHGLLLVKLELLRKLAYVSR